MGEIRLVDTPVIYLGNELLLFSLIEGIKVKGSRVTVNFNELDEEWVILDKSFRKERRRCKAKKRIQFQNNTARDSLCCS